MRLGGVGIRRLAHRRSILAHHARGHEDLSHLQRRVESAAKTRAHYLIHPRAPGGALGRLSRQLRSRAIGHHEPPPPVHHGRPRETQRPRQSLGAGENTRETPELERLSGHQK
jgi:hypothetical protein